MITQASYAADGSVTASPIEGATWQGITPEHRFWVDVQEYVASGGVIAPYEPPNVPPPTLTRRQLRLGLLASGITTAQIETVIAAIGNPLEREMAQIEWADASTYERHHPLVDQIGTVMDLTPEQIDAMWVAAATL